MAGEVTKHTIYSAAGCLVSSGKFFLLCLHGSLAGKCSSSSKVNKFCWLRRLLGRGLWLRGNVGVVVSAPFRGGASLKIVVIGLVIDILTLLGTGGQPTTFDIIYLTRYWQATPTHLGVREDRGHIYCQRHTRNGTVALGHTYHLYMVCNLHYSDTITVLGTYTTSWGEGYLLYLY